MSKSDETNAARSAVAVIVDGATDNPDDATARMLTRPEVQASALIQKLEGDNLEVNAVVRELERQIALVQAGDLRRGEATLVAQAHALDELFTHLARRAQAAGGYLRTVETYLRLALKAQAQCRSTWQTLAEMKNPRPLAVFNQANISNGPQQVNNGITPSGNAQAVTPSDENRPNELLEAMDGERLDTRAPGTAGEVNPELATVGAIDRTKD